MAKVTVENYTGEHTVYLNVFFVIAIILSVVMIVAGSFSLITLLWAIPLVLISGTVLDLVGCLIIAYVANL